MTRNPALHPADLRGTSQLVVDGVLGLSHLVEALHHTIANTPKVLGKHAPGPTRGITGLSYRSVRWVTGLVGNVLDTALVTLIPPRQRSTVSPRREAVLAALNGVLGDHLAETGNPLAIPMQFRRDGHPLALNKDALAATFSRPSGKLMIFLHGLCMNDLQWGAQPPVAGDEAGAAEAAVYSPATQMADDLGYTPLYLHYNTGLHISQNGQAFSAQMAALIDHWPVAVQEVAFVAHSMGGLVARSACHYAAQAGATWLPLLKKLVFLGTPHLGAPLERGGQWVDVTLGVSPYTAPFARLGKIRSAGITDMRYSNLTDEDWAGSDRFAFSPARPRPLPLPKGVKCYAIAATTGKRRGDLRDRLLGDGLVPVESALGHHADADINLALPASRQWIAHEMDHFALLSHPAVYARLRRWLGGRAGSTMSDDTLHPRQGRIRRPMTGQV